MSTLFAQPLNSTARGFSFNSKKEFIDNSLALSNNGYEISYATGVDLELFNECEIDESNLEFWFDDVEPLNNQYKIALYFLITNTGRLVTDLINEVGDVIIYNGCLIDAAIGTFDELYLPEIPENLQQYIDYNKFAADQECNGNFVEFRFNKKTYVCTNANEF